MLQEELADLVWEVWDLEMIDSEVAAIAWLLLRPQDSGIVRIKSG